MNKLKRSLIGSLLGAVLIPIMITVIIGPPALLINLIAHYQPTNELGAVLSLLVIFGWLGFLFGLLSD